VLQVATGCYRALHSKLRFPDVTGDLSTAEEVFTQEIAANASKYTLYANHSLVIARKYDWRRTLEDALKVRFAHYRSQ
jgi:hypothetical protein